MPPNTPSPSRRAPSTDAGRPQAAAGKRCGGRAGFAALAGAILLALAGCATAPAFDIGQADTTLTPREAASEGEASRLQGRLVAWGGVIIAGKNLQDSTQLEVLAYPLDEDHRPRTDTDPAGRFLITHPGYLEIADYAPGRLVTVVGRLVGTHRGRIGEAEYVYPVVAADRLRLWPRAPRTRTDTEPHIHFGIGIGIIK